MTSPSGSPGLPRWFLVPMALALAALPLLLLRHHRHAASAVADAAASSPAVPGGRDGGVALAGGGPAQAACHPHLVDGPGFEPQVDVRALVRPDVAHMKIRFQVDGGKGTVQGAQLVYTNFGSPQEQAAQVAFVQQLVFSVPDIADCRRLAIEVNGDVFESVDPMRGWTTRVRLYPKYAFDARGALQAAD